MKEKVVFITGAKGGLGSFITRRFLETGVTVVGASRSISQQVANLLVGALYLYGIAGLVFAIAFVTTGVKRIDSQAIGSGVCFLVLIFPASVAFWPLLLCRWITRTSQPPEERNPHR